MSLQVVIKVVPSSGRNKFLIDKNGVFKCYLKSAPEKGLANKELVKLLSKALKISQQDVVIIAGRTSRTKKVSINVDFTYAQMLERIGIQEPDIQQSLW